MPNWKKLIHSGSNAILASLFVENNITASSNISASGFISASSFNATPGTTNQLTSSYAITASYADNAGVTSLYEAGDGAGSIQPVANNNNASGTCSTIGGGRDNIASGTDSTIGGGDDHDAIGNCSTVGGGFCNKAYDDHSTIAGGCKNSVQGDFTFIGGGCSNTVSSSFASILVGRRNYVYGRCSTISGGYRNCIMQGADNSSITAAGSLNIICSPNSHIGGGYGNVISGSNTATIGGGQGNNIYQTNYGGTVGGGRQNKICPTAAGANATDSTISGGYRNCIFGQTNTIGGGQLHEISGSANFIGGGNDHCIKSIAFNSILGGQQNQIFGNYYGTIGGGLQHRICGVNNNASTISGGYRNCVHDSCATVGGGRQNEACENSSTVGGGYLNCAAGNCSTVGGGCLNTAGENAATIAGGKGNTASACYSTVGGGCNNNIDGTNTCCSTIAGGRGNTISGDTKNSTIGGGIASSITSGHAHLIAGGTTNTIADSGGASVVVGGSSNSISGTHGMNFIGGGTGNCVNGSCLNVIVGGTSNCSAGKRNFIGGGQNNCTVDACSAVVGGLSNCVPGKFSSIVTGKNNTVSGLYSGILAGENNSISHNCSFIIGSDLTSDAACTTYVNNLNVSGSLAIPGFTNVSASLALMQYQPGDGVGSIVPIANSNTTAGNCAKIGGGNSNSAASCFTFIGGGENNNIAIGIYGSIVGGKDNTITRAAGSGGAYSFIGGGTDNCSCANYGVVGGGCSNHLDNNTYASSVVGGQDNHIEKSCYSFIGGGKDNCIKETTATANDYNTIVGGLGHLMRDNCNPDVAPIYSFIGGGQCHEINSVCFGSILGGTSNDILGESHLSTIAGGNTNKITNCSQQSFIGGGNTNCISGSHNAVIGGGCENVLGTHTFNDSDLSIIGGGYRNCINGIKYSGILGGKNNTFVSCNLNPTFIIGSDICVNKAGTTATGGCMTFVNNLCAWGTDGTDGTIRACKITQTGETAIEFKKMKSGDSDPIEVESDLQITTGKAIKGASPIVFADTANITASMNSGTFTHPAIIASGSEAIQATGSVGILGVLAIPGFTNVSASLAAAGNVSTSGTPANNQLSVFTNSDTIEGDSDLTYNSSTKLLSAPTASFDHLIVSQVISSSVINTSGSNIFGDEATDTQTLNGSVILNNLQNQASEATALMINGSNVVGTRQLGSNAFTNTTIGTTTGNLTVDATTLQLNTGTIFNGSATRNISAKTAAITEAGTGLATSAQIYTFVTGLGYNSGTVTSVGTNTGLSGTVTTSGNLSLALADLADMTQAWDNSADEFIVLDGGTQKRKLSSEIFGSNAFTSTSIPTAVTDLSDVSSAGSGQIITTTERNAISSNTSQISTNTSQISTNTSNISTNTSTLGEKAGNGENSDITELTGLTTALSVGQGGTGLTSLTATYIPYGNGASAFKSSPALAFNETNKQLILTGINSAGNSPLSLVNVLEGGESDITALILDSSNHVVKKDLGSNAFNSTNFLTSLSGAVLTSGNQSAAGTKTFTGQIVIGANGSISAPMIRFPGSSTNTGFYSSNPDEISITRAGSQAFKFDANGLQVLLSGTSQFSGHLRAHCLGVGGAAPGTSGEIWAYGDVVANYSSDKRLKKNIKPISGALDKLSTISGVEFDWIEKEEVHSHKGHDVGVIAQEVEKVLPEVVATRDNGYKAVNYEKIVPLLIEAIKDLKAEVDELKKSK